MRKERLTSIVIAGLLVLSTLMLAFVPANVPNVQASDTVRHSVSMSPMTKTLDTLPKDVDYWVNVTSSGNDFINKACIKLPTGWTNRTVTAPSGWSIDAFDGWLNFTTAGTGFKDNAIVNFSIPITISMIPTVGTWKIYCYQGTTSSVTNPVSITVTVNLQFSSTISPNYVKNGTSYIYTVTTTNDASSVGIKQVNITFPAGTWTFNVLVDYSPRTWTVSYDSALSTFKLTGPPILIGESMMIKVNLTTPVGAVTGEYYWDASAWDSGDNYLGKYSMKAVVDASKPTVSFDAPGASYYTVASGNYIWVNVTITDTPSIETHGITVAINDTDKFQPHPTKPYEKVSPTVYKYFFVNKTAILDGKLAVKVTATDPAGNVGSAVASTTVDNTAPLQLWVKVMDVTGTPAVELPFVDGIYWMGGTTTKIQVNATFYNSAGFTGTIYLNTTSGGFTNGTLWPTTPFDVTTSDYVTLNITLVDGALPTANKFTQAWEIKRDKVKPTAPTYTTEAICGGAVVRQLNATDNVGVLKYRIYINGTYSEVTLSELNSAYMSWVSGGITFDGTLVLDLTAYAGKSVNLTICTIDFGANPSDPTTHYLSIPEERWYPIELYKDWNIISLPLVPANSAVETVLSLLLKPGLLESVWTYDAQTTSWYVYSPGAPSDLTTMVDGKGYLVEMTAYNVLIIQGREQPPPPATPRAYYVVPGWNLIGYKEITYMTASSYLTGTSWIRIYRFNPITQTYETVHSGTNMEPGRGYWVAFTSSGWIYP